MLATKGQGRASRGRGQCEYGNVAKHFKTDNQKLRLVFGDGGRGWGDKFYQYGKPVRQRMDPEVAVPGNMVEARISIVSQVQINKS